MNLRTWVCAFVSRHIWREVGQRSQWQTEPRRDALGPRVASREVVTHVQQCRVCGKTREVRGYGRLANVTSAPEATRRDARPC